MGSSSYISNLDGEVVQHIEYVPFGEVFLEEKNSKWNTPYLFTSKELDRETGMYYFSARYQDPKLGVFISVDPLAEKYAGWSSYAYTLNNPINAIDPDGREVFFIHGTSSDSKRWNLKIIRAIMRLSNNKSYNAGFNWNAPLSNNKNDRYKAAQSLAEYVIANHKDGEEITLAGHSHGGNVAIQAADIIYKKTGQKVNIVTIATPAYNGDKDAENPKNHKGINDHIALWNIIDGVSGGAAGDDNYTNSPKTRNVEINVDQYYKTRNVRRDRFGQTSIDEVNDKIGAHSFDVDHPELIDRKIQQKNIKLEPVN